MYQPLQKDLKMKKIFSFFVCCIFAAGMLLFTGCSDPNSKKIKIGVCIPAATHGWAGGVVWNAEKSKKKLEEANKDVEVLIASGENSSDQVDRIENMLAQNVKALVVMSQEPGPLTAVCERAKKQGVFLVIVSNPLDKKVEDVFVNGDNKSFGKAAAEAVGKLLKGKGSIVVMEGTQCPINTDRAGTFKKVIREKFPHIRILDSQPAHWNTEKGLLLMETFLQKFPKIDAVWAGDDDVLTGALKAYKESKRKDVQFFVGGGGAKGTVKMIMENDPLVKATVTYSPAMISTGIEEALQGVRMGGKLPGGRKEIIIPSLIILKENAEKYYFPDSIY